MKERNWIVIPDTNLHPVLAFIVLETGQCGTESKEVQLWQAGSGNDELLWQLAKDNAESYGIYPASEYDEEEDGTEYTDNIEGSAYLFHPDNLSSTFETAHQILYWLCEIGAIEWREGFSNTVIIEKDIILQSMDYDFDSFCEMVKHNISGEFYIFENTPEGKSRTIGEAEQRPSVINKERLFDGLSIKDISDNIDNTHVIDKFSAPMIKDLIEYIRELEQR